MRRRRPWCGEGAGPDAVRAQCASDETDGLDAQEQPLSATFRGAVVMRIVAAVVVTAILIGTLYFGREVFVPIALAILLSFVLAPLVELLHSAWTICHQP